MAIMDPKTMVRKDIATGQDFIGKVVGIVEDVVDGRRTHQSLKRAKKVSSAGQLADAQKQAASSASSGSTLALSAAPVFECPDNLDIPEDFRKATVVECTPTQLTMFEDLEQEFVDLDEYKQVMFLKYQEEELEAQEFAAPINNDANKAELAFRKMAGKVKNKYQQMVDETYVELDAACKSVMKDFKGAIADEADEEGQALKERP